MAIKPELQADLEAVLKHYPDEYKMAYEIIGNLYSESPTRWPVAYIKNILEKLQKRNVNDSKN